MPCLALSCLAFGIHLNKFTIYLIDREDGVVAFFRSIRSLIVLIGWLDVREHVLKHRTIFSSILSFSNGINVTANHMWISRKFVEKTYTFFARIHSDASHKLSVIKNRHIWKSWNVLFERIEWKKMKAKCNSSLNWIRKIHTENVFEVAICELRALLPILKLHVPRVE